MNFIFLLVLPLPFKKIKAFEMLNEFERINEDENYFSRTRDLWVDVGKYLCFELQQKRCTLPH